jgi:hypothetical protein
MKNIKDTAKKTTAHYPLFIIVLAFFAGIFIGYTLSSQKSTSSPIKQSKQSISDVPKKACTALTVTTPNQGDTVTAPLHVQVVVDNTNPDCHWTVFEAQAGTMELRDGTDHLVGTGILTTAEDWMTDQPVTYTGTIPFTNMPVDNGLTLTISEDDPSGQNHQEIVVPLIY